MTLKLAETKYRDHCDKLLFISDIHNNCKASNNSKLSDEDTHKDNITNKDVVVSMF